MRFKKLAALALLVFLGSPLTATAIPVQYQIKFTALAGSVLTTSFPTAGAPTVDIADAAGNVYFGLFAVDDAVLLTDGIGKPGTLDFLYIRMEDNIWGYNFAGDNSFAGFRGPIPGNAFCMMSMACVGAPSPGFDVVNGAVTNLRGGVFGVADLPFVDFSLLGANTFNATGATFGAGPGTSFSRVRDVSGTLEIVRVAEPATLLPFGAGLLMLLAALRTSRRKDGAPTGIRTPV